MGIIVDRAAAPGASEVESVAGAFPARLHDGMDVKRSALDVADVFDRVSKPPPTRGRRTKKGADDAEQLTATHQRAVLDLRASVLNYSEAVGTIPESTTTEILAAIDRGDLVAAETALNKLARDRPVTLQVKFDFPHGRPAIGAGNVPVLATAPAPTARGAGGRWRSCRRRRPSP